MKTDFPLNRLQPDRKCPACKVFFEFLDEGFNIFDDLCEACTEKEKADALKVNHTNA